MQTVSAIELLARIHEDWGRAAPWALLLAIGAACTDPVRHAPDKVTGPSAAAHDASTAVTAAWTHIAFDLQIDANETWRPAHSPLLVHVEHDKPSAGPGKTIYTFPPTVRGTPGIEAGPRGISRIEVDGATGKSQAFRKDGTAFDIGNLGPLPTLGFDAQRNIPDSLRRLRDAMRSRTTASGGAGASWIDGLVVQPGSAGALARRLSAAGGPGRQDTLGRERYVAVRGARTLELVVDPAIDDMVETALSENGRVLGRTRYQHQVLPSGVVLRSKIIREQSLASGTRTLSMGLSNIALTYGGK